MEGRGGRPSSGGRRKHPQTERMRGGSNRGPRERGGEVECDVREVKVEAGAAGGGVIEREGEDALKMAHPAMVLASQV